jgi:hypothetical protein
LKNSRRRKHIAGLCGVHTATKGQSKHLLALSGTNLESIIAALQNKVPALQKAMVPRLFHNEEDISSENVDYFDQPFTSASFRPPFAPGVFNATCDLTILQNEITKYNEDILESGKDDDILKRRGLYDKVLAWRKSLPGHLLNEVNYTPGASLLRLVRNPPQRQYTLT